MCNHCFRTATQDLSITVVNTRTDATRKIPIYPDMVLQLWVGNGCQKALGAYDLTQLWSACGKYGAFCQDVSKSFQNGTGEGGSQSYTTAVKDTNSDQSLFAGKDTGASGAQSYTMVAKTNESSCATEEDIKEVKTNIYIRSARTVAKLAGG